MPLRLELKPNERLIVGRAALRNGPRRTSLYLENSVPVLRGSDIVTQSEADTLEKQLYVALEYLYLASDRFAAETEVMRLVAEIFRETPGRRPALEELVAVLRAGDLYRALKLWKPVMSDSGEGTSAAS